MKSIRAYLVAAAVIIASPVTITHADEPPLGDPPVVNVDPSCGVTITGEKVEIKNEEGEIIGEVNKLWLRVNDDDNNADEKWDIGSEQVAGEDDTYQITVTATLKDTCVASETGGIRVKVYMDDASKDRIDGFWPGKRIIKDENGASTEETGDDALAKVKGVPKEYPYYVPILPGQSVTQTLYIEGIHHSAAASDVNIRAETTDTNHCTKHGIKTAESLSLSAYQVDLDVDSNNDNTFDFEGFDDAEDKIEASEKEDDNGSKRPGKIVISSSQTNSDGDDVPDFADGFNLPFTGTVNELAQVSETLKFVPVQVELKAPFDTASAKVKFTYGPVSKPELSEEGIGFTGAGTPEDPYVFNLNKGGMRLWKKKATERTSGEAVPDGDFIPADTEINWSDIAIDSSTPRIAKLYLEYVDTSPPEAAGRKDIKVIATQNDVECEDKSTLTPVAFKTYPDTEAGPDKAHKKNLTTRQDETAKHGTGWEKVVCKIWDSSPGKVNLIDYLDGGPGNHSTYENMVKWRVDGTERTDHELALGAKPGSEKHTHFYVQVMPKNGGGTLDRLIITVVPPETKTKFDNWYADESTAAGKAWFAQCPSMPSSLEISPLQSPDRMFITRIWLDPSDWSAAGGGTYFHPDAYYEIRAVKTSGGHGHQTTFRATGSLILSGVSAGTADKAAAYYFPGNLDFLSHIYADVVPFMWALQLDGNPCDQNTTTLTMPMLHEGAFIKKYMECRPVEPNTNPRFTPGGPQL